MIKKRAITYQDGIALVHLTRGRTAMIDPEDASRVEKFNWSFDRLGYAAGWVDGRIQRLHRFILHAPKGLVVDHVNHDKLDNRKANLRLATRRENGANRARLQSNNVSGYAGVSWNKAVGKWQAFIYINSKSHHLGLFHCPIEAAVCRDVAAVELYGRFATLNFPQIADIRPQAIQRVSADRDAHLVQAGMLSVLTPNGGRVDLSADDLRALARGEVA